MGRSNLIPITRIYDIYPKYTYSDDVKKFMDEIVDIDRANVYTKDDVIAMFEELQSEIDEKAVELCDDGWWLTYNNLIQQKINEVKEDKDGKDN